MNQGKSRRIRKQIRKRILLEREALVQHMSKGAVGDGGQGEGREERLQYKGSSMLAYFKGSGEPLKVLEHRSDKIRSVLSGD